MNVLLVNAGSSSLKVSVLEAQAGGQISSAFIDWSKSPSAYSRSSEGKTYNQTLNLDNAGAALEQIISDLELNSISAVAHRIVHGGDLTSSVLINEELLSKLEAISALAPLHNPPSLLAARSAIRKLPGLPQVAVFDTAFHRRMLPEAEYYAVPMKWYQDWGIKRYGFHGLSYAYCAKRGAEFLNQPIEQSRSIICHLGHGSSIAAVSGGRCLDTSMGFTPLDGIMMATRSGSLDPGLILHLQTCHGLTPVELLKVLNEQSGLLGIAGLSADMRQLLSAAETGHQPATLAIEMYCYQVAKTIAALNVPLGTANSLVFTAGIGQNSPQIRAKICKALEFLGVKLDSILNEQSKSDAIISASDSKLPVLILTTREDLSLLAELKAVLEGTKLKR